PVPVSGLDLHVLPGFSFHVLEKRLYPSQPRRLARTVTRTASLQRRLELLQQGLLLFCQVHGRFDLHLAVEVADDTAAHRLHALAAQPELLAALGFGGNLERDAAVQGRDFDFAAEYGGRETDRHIAVQVAALAPEYTVGTNVDLDVEIARRAAVFPGL